MKNKLILGGLMVLTLVGAAQATIVLNQNFSVGAAIPDGSPVGFATSQTFSTLGASLINQVDVRLQITGGYNGDLYGYLVLQSTDNSTATSILLNRVGRTDAAGFGDIGGGFNVTLSGDLTQGYQNIHGVTGTIGTQTAGTYLADGRTTDPNGNFSGATSTAGLSVLNGRNANGTWTLFLADMAGGDQSTLVSWGLNISVVPEPITWALGIFGVMLGLLKLSTWRQNQNKA